MTQDDFNAAFLDSVLAVNVEIDGVPHRAIVSAGYENPTLDGQGDAGSQPTAIVRSDAINPDAIYGVTFTVLSGSLAGQYTIQSQTPDSAGCRTLTLWSK